MTQNDVLKQSEKFFKLYYEALSQTSTNQVVSGRSGVEKLFGEFESNNFDEITSIPIYFLGLIAVILVTWKAATLKFLIIFFQIIIKTGVLVRKIL